MMSNLTEIAKENGADVVEPYTSVTSKREMLTMTPAQLQATVEQVCKPLVDALKHSRGALEMANLCGAINDTLWASKTETLFDYMDNAIESHNKLMGKE
jgi:hypothetical protein